MCNYGERSSVGRAPVCGTGCRGFEPHRPPHVGISPSGKAIDFDSVMRRFESCHPSHLWFTSSVGRAHDF